MVDEELYEYLNQWKWSKYGNYFIRRVQNKKVITTIYMHRLIVDAPKGLVVDHINGDTTDNRMINLRICTKQQNNFNKRIGTRNTSGFKGVFWAKDKKRWKSCVAITIGGKKKRFTSEFKSKEQAIKSYENKAREVFGEFARINSL